MLFAYTKLVHDPDGNRQWVWGLLAPILLPFLVIPLTVIRDRRRVAVTHWRRLDEACAGNMEPSA
jgi:hypothetical protein